MSPYHFIRLFRTSIGKTPHQYILRCRAVINILLFRSFFTATKFSSEIALATPFYGMVFDEWIEAVTNITIPVYLFFGGVDPFINSDRIKQIDSRFKELGKNYRLKVYLDAEHGFFGDERSSYNPSAAQDSWYKLIKFFQQYL